MNRNAVMIPVAVLMQRSAKSLTADLPGRPPPLWRIASHPHNHETNAMLRSSEVGGIHQLPRHTVLVQVQGCLDAFATKLSRDRKRRGLQDGNLSCAVKKSTYGLLRSKRSPRTFSRTKAFRPAGIDGSNDLVEHIAVVGRPEVETARAERLAGGSG